MKHSILVILGVLLLGAVTWVVLDSGPAPENPNGSGDDPRSEDPRHDNPADPHQGDGGSGGQRDPVRGGRRRDPGGRGAPRAITVRGRCVAKRDGIPLAGVAVDVAVVVRAFGRSRTPDQVTTAAPRLYTGDDGRFETAVVVPNRHQVRVGTHLDGRASMRGYLYAGRGNTLNVGDIKMPPGARLAANVFDEDAVPQPRIAFRLYQAMTGGRDRIAPVNWLDLKSDFSGRIDTDVALAAGRWTISPQNEVKVLKPGTQLEVPEDQTELRADIVVQLPDPKGMITGKLVDEQGAPVPNIAIHAKNGGEWPIGYGRSDAQGRFQVKCRTQPDKPALLRVDRAPGFEPLTSTQAYPWGSQDLVLTLVRAADLTVEVVAQSDAAPVEDYGVVWYAPNQQGIWYQGGRERVAHHPDGKATVRAVPSGKLRLVVVPRGKTFATNAPYEFTKAPGNKTVRVALARRVELPVRVVDNRGKPVAKTRLQLVRSTDGKPVTLQSYGVEPAQAGQFQRMNSQVLVLDRNQTRADGTATLAWRLGDRDLAIRVLGPGHVPKVHAPVTLQAENETLEIKVEAGGAITGSVTPRAVLEALSSNAPGTRTQRPSVVLTYKGEALQGSHRNKTAFVDERGRFAIEGLAAGSWSVLLRVWRRGAGRGGNMIQQSFDAVDLGQGERREITLEITGMRPATLKGQLFVGRQPHAGKQVYLTRILPRAGGGHRYARDTVARTDNRGAFTAEGIQAGRYSVSILTERGGPVASMRLVATEIVDVPAGQSIERTFTIECGRLHARILDHEGKPAAVRWIVVRSSTSGFRTSARTNDKGILDIAQIAIGEYELGVFPVVKRLPGRLRAPGRNEWISLGKIQVNRGADPAKPTDFSLPEPKKN